MSTCAALFGHALQKGLINFMKLDSRLLQKKGKDATPLPTQTEHQSRRGKRRPDLRLPCRREASLSYVAGLVGFFGVTDCTLAFLTQCLEVFEHAV